MGKGGLLTTLMAALVMGVLAFTLGGGIPPRGATGLCLGAPETWGLVPTLAWGLNLLLILVAGTSLYFLNKSYSLVRGADATLPAVYIFMTCANPWVSTTLTSSSVMAVVLIAALALLFGCYRRRNATQEIFVVATLLALGSMFQYGFVLLIPGIIIVALLLKCLHFKEILAFILGLAAPYWVALGFGLVRPEDFALPSLENIFWTEWNRTEVFTGVAVTAITSLGATVLALDNTVRLYAGNTRRRIFNVALLVMGLNLIACMVIDYRNLPAYIASLYIFAAVQLPSFYTLRNVRAQTLWTILVMLFYLAGFIAMEF